MRYANCSKCGAIHGKTSKHKPTVTSDGLAWCGHCGTRLHMKNPMLVSDEFKKSRSDQYQATIFIPGTPFEMKGELTYPIPENGIPKGSMITFIG